MFECDWGARNVVLAEGSCGVEEAACKAVESREMRMEPTLPGRPMHVARCNQ